MNSNNIMYVLKRNGSKEEVSFDKVLNRIKKMSQGFSKFKTLDINAFTITQKVVSQIYDGVNTAQLDELTAQLCASMITEHPDYGDLASRIVVSNHHKNTSPSLSETIYILYNNKDVHGNHSPLVSKDIYDIVMQNKNKLNDIIDYNSDYLFDYFGFKTLERSYLMKINGKIVERPQHMIMRVCLGIHLDDFKDALGMYKAMSHKYFTHATPTLFNSGTPRPQLSSCFLIAMKDDSIDGIFSTLKESALISKWAGGIGIHVHNIRAKDSNIRGTNGISNGLIPMLRVFNNTARYVDQGGGKRKGSIAIYLEPWHSDIFNFLDLKKNHGNEEERARDLFYSLWVPDLFMKRVQSGSKWTLMCPDKCPGLSDSYGEEFEKLYVKYEESGKGNKSVSAQELWFKILESQIETGTPYILYKDACNLKSNQKNLGTIKSSNLCTEIIEYSSKDETAVCNLASIGLSKFVKNKDLDINSVKIYTKTSCVYCKLGKALLKKNNIKYEEINLDNDEERKTFYSKMNSCNDESCKIEDKQIRSVPQIFVDDEHIGGYMELLDLFRPEFDFDKLLKVSRILTKNLNKVIDRNFYPSECSNRSNKRHRPIGLGVQGLADTFALMKIPFDSNEAKDLNRKIFETIYYGSLCESLDISKKREESMRNIKNLRNIEGKNEMQEKELRDLEKIYKPIDEELNREKYLGAYSTFDGSPASKGILQFDMWNKEPSDSFDWLSLKEEIKKYGIRNSLLIAPMPTASTSQILGNNECFEPFTANIYTRRTLAGEFIIVNKYLLSDLIDAGLWNNDLKNEILVNEGSIQNISNIPNFLKNIYKTVWEIKQKDIIDMAVDRGVYIDQSQSLNLFLSDPDYQKLTSMHFYGWKNGLKTGIYYLRTKSKAKAQQFTIDPLKKRVSEEPEICESCSG